MFTTTTSLDITTARLLFHCNETVSRHSERSLLGDNLMCDLLVKVLCGHDNVCLLRIDSFDSLMIDVHVGTLAQAYIYDIANESLNCDITLRYWVICELN